MYPAFDHILTQVPDLEAAMADYSTLLPAAGTDGFALANVNVQLQQVDDIAAPRIAALALLDPAMAPGTSAPLAGGPRKIPLLRANNRDPRYCEPESATGIYAVDHLVLQSADAEACIELFREQLGLRLALDQEVPEWGGRMLFFRHGKMTLEVIHNLEKPPARDSFWGITYLCHDIDQTLAALAKAGVQHSPLRQGRKPGTRVSTLNSHCLGLPTLLISP
ncbi:hypothetical protein DWB85_13045 [Seongchinamella sediminis]|uniref:VOC domain-containing protein n=1 Tax=Seongchinamella sediminis TaxID=2283635 RepID=A0A3L7DZF8_9GAMM|nr:VOC family protein [Seongchinamella sediminis]RLQ21232.1 hypothetical protein DWB85_13045 [Seongchinamella sediminis]